MVKLNFCRVFLAGVLFAVLAQVIHTLGAFLAMGYYTMPEYFSVWSKIMMPSAGPPPLSFMVYSIIFGVISGILISLVYSVVKSSIPGNKVCKKGLVYGLFVFLVGGIPGYLSLFLLINLPSALILSWAFETLLVDLFGGVVIAKILK